MRREPCIHVGRQMPNDLAATRMYPHVRWLGAGRVGHEDQAIPFFETVDDARAFPEDGPVHWSAKLGSSREDRRHWTSVSGWGLSPWTTHGAGGVVSI